ncbi:MAG: ABC transporter substrate-binding protein [Actinomycetota bacterium]|nr:ABC transporter substrate-binding protein [Actinomycetota bacterium]MDQ5808464.1 ABC transporter substrate-binding protein [Actinomycetota bacterium]
MIRKPLALAAALAALVLAGCGEREDPEPGAREVERIDLVLDFFPNADHAGIYAAIGNGDFERAGLDVKPATPSDPAAPLRLLAAGRADLAISYEPEVLLARDRGLKVVAIGAIVQKPLTSVMSLGDRAIKDPAQLQGKKVGTAGIPYQSAYLKAILDEAGVDPADVEEVNVGFNLGPAMITKRVDATLGAFWNYEGVQLERDRRRPTILRVEELGVPTYNELVVVAREEDARERGPVLRRFMLALARGHEALRDDPRAGIDPLLRANRDLERGLQEASVRATLPVFFPEDDERSFGYMEEREWEAYGRWMADNGLLKQREDPRRALTNEFVPGEGPQAAEGP